MKNIITVILTLLFLSDSSFIFSQILSDDEKKILTLQDKRTLGEKDDLLKYLETSDEKIILKALNALANIADSTSVYKTFAFLQTLYNNNNTSELLNEYAYYLGQTLCEQSMEKLSMMSVSENVNVNQSYPEILNSLGKTGNENDMNNLISILPEKKFDIEYRNKVYSALALSIGRFALRKIRNKKSVEALKQIANIEDSIVQRNTAFAFWRTGDKLLLDTAKQEIYNLAQSEDAQTRMWYVNAIGKLQDKALFTLMLDSFRAETDWRVQVNMLNAMANYRLDLFTDLTDQIYSVIGTAIGSSNEHVSLTAIEVMGKIFADINKSENAAAKIISKEIKSNIIYALDSVNEISWRQKSELVNSFSLIFRDEVKDEMFEAYSRTKDFNVKAGIIKAFGNFDSGMVYREVRKVISDDVQKYNTLNPNTSGDMIGSKDLAKLYRSFVEMLTSLDKKVDDENQNTIRLIYTEFGSSKDPQITDICLNALKDSLYLKYREETSSVMLFDYNELESPKDDDVNLIFIDAMKDLYNEETKKKLIENLNSENYEIAKSSANVLETITGNKYEFTAKPKYDFDWDYIEGLSQKKNLIIKTNKGNINIELLPEVAPFTVMNFLKLADKNFFDSLIFHRVVPNFVIQGGDPTGTGYGGPGYSIRSEFSKLTFETGMVGMASSGKDTEGSQFFITHSATPHLDGKYTIFGKVTSGMEVVDNIMEGDYIEDIKILR